MSVENRIFWLLVGILALYIVFSARGRNAVTKFLYEVFGVGPAVTAPVTTPPAGGQTGGPNPGQVPSGVA